MITTEMSALSVGVVECVDSIWVKPSTSTENRGYVASDVEALVLELWVIWNIFSLILLADPLLVRLDKY